MRIGVDVDSVLAPTVDAFCVFLRSKGYNKTYDDFRTMNWVEVVGVEPDKMVDLVYEFYESEPFLAMDCIKDSQAILKELANKHELFVISSRQRFLQKSTEEWINKHYPGIFKAIFVCDNHYDHRSEHPTEKAEVCIEHGVTHLIEDDPHHINHAVSQGVNVIIMDQPWNKSIPGSQRVTSWKEIALIFDEK